MIANNFACLTSRLQISEPYWRVCKSHFFARQWTPYNHQANVISFVNDAHQGYDDGEGGVGVHPKSHKHLIPYMGFCASIWDSVRHHCHHHHHHHDHLKWTVKQQRRRPKNLWANFKRLGWMDISILRHGPALDGRQTWQTTARKPTMASSTGR